jgi:uncharacterized protein DUF748
MRVFLCFFTIRVADLKNMQISKVRKIIALCLGVLALFMLGGTWWGYGHLTALVQQQLRGMIGEELTIGKASVRWNRVELDQVRLLRRGRGPFPQRLAIERLVLRPRLTSLFSGRLELGEITLDKPYLLLEIAPDGSLVNPLPSRPTPTRQTRSGSALPVTISGLKISEGTVDLIDRHVAHQDGAGLSNPREQYHKLKFQQISLKLGAFDIPSTNRAAPLQLTLKMQGGGSLALKGSISPQSLDSRLRLDVSDLDITRLRPYFIKKGDLDVTAGLLSVDCSIAIEKRYLKAPGEIVLKELSFDQSGSKGFWKGMPVWALKKVAADGKGDLRVKFAMNGSLDNPRFTVRQSFIELLVTGLSSKIGIPTASSIGKGLIDSGSSGVKGLLKVFGR